MHQLAQAPLAVRAPDGAMEVFAGHDVGRSLRPVGRHFHVRLFEDDVPLHVGDHRRPLLPLERVVGSLAFLEVTGEVALERQAAPDLHCLFGTLGPGGSSHSRSRLYANISSCQAHRFGYLHAAGAAELGCCKACRLQATVRTTLAHSHDTPTLPCVFFSRHTRCWRSLSENCDPQEILHIFGRECPTFFDSAPRNWGAR